MPFEITEGLGASSPPNLLIIATEDNIDGWVEDVMNALPTTGNLAMNRRHLIELTLFATNSPSTAQLGEDSRASTYFFITRRGQRVTQRVMAPIHMHGGGGSNTANRPMAHWLNPLPFPLRGGDVLNILIPGDANATPTQDWEINALFGRELKR